MANTCEEHINKKAIDDIVKCLEWYVENDDTNNIPENKYWLENLENAKKALDIYHESCKVKE